MNYFALPDCCCGEGLQMKLPIFDVNATSFKCVIDVESLSFFFSFYHSGLILSSHIKLYIYECLCNIPMHEFHARNEM
jgi:hypothetical protein